MITVLIISIFICFFVIGITVVVTNKAYAYKHTVDPLENNPHMKSQEANSTLKQVKEE